VSVRLPNRPVGEAISAFGRVDSIVNNAQSFAPHLTVDEIPEEYIRTNFESGFMGSLQFMQVAFP